MKVGELLDAMNVSIRLEEGDLLSDVIVIARVMQADGSSRLSTSTSQGTNWVTKIGMLRIASQTEELRITHPADPDED